MNTLSGRLSLLGVVLTALLSAPAGAGAKPQLFEGETYGNWTEMVVTQVPPEIRDVPVKLSGPSFEGDSLIPGQRYTVAPMLGFGVSHRRLTARVGDARIRLGLRWILLPYPWSGRTNVRKFSHATTPDGIYYGNLTTSYAIAPRGLLPGWAWRDPIWQATTGNGESGPGVGVLYWLLNFTPFIQAEAPISTDGRVKLSATLSFYRVEAMSGWIMPFDPVSGAPVDGWDDPDDEPYSKTYRRQTLAYCYPLSLGLKYRGVTLGARYLVLNPTALGRRSGLAPNRLTGYASVGF